MRKIRRRRRRKIITTIRGGGGSSGKVSRPYVNKRNRLMLGEEKRIKKQRGSFITPIAAALTGPALQLFGSLIKGKYGSKR